jgi:CP family cyanate transporter-like MFS transporter
MTALMGAGIAIAQPALPTLVRAWLSARIALGTATASNGMVLGPVAPVALSLPLLLPLAGGWRGVLALWSLPLALIALALLFAPGAPRPAASAPRAPMRANSALVWRLGLVFAGTNSVYFCVNAFAPGLLAAQDRADLISPTLTAFHLGQLPATLIAGFFARRVETSVWPYVATGLIMEAMLLALVSGAGAWTIFWAACLGFFNCTSLVFGLALPALLAAPADVPRLAAGMFTVSYSCAMAVAVAGGAAWDLAGDARWAFLPVAASVLPMIALAPIRRTPS